MCFLHHLKNIFMHQENINKPSFFLNVSCIYISDLSSDLTAAKRLQDPTSSVLPSVFVLCCSGKIHRLRNSVLRSSVCSSCSVTCRTRTERHSTPLMLLHLGKIVPDCLQRVKLSCNCTFVHFHPYLNILRNYTIGAGLKPN